MLPEQEKGISHLTTLPRAAERLRVLVADLDEPGSFNAPIAGCMGVFHLAHPIDLEDKEDEETKTKEKSMGPLVFYKLVWIQRLLKRWCILQL